jgi:hypothetical protein
VNRLSLLRRALAIVAPLAMLGALSAWAFASPVGSSPDDDYHQASIWCSHGDREGLCEPGKDEQHRVVAWELRYNSLCYNFRPDVSADCPVYPGRTVDTDRGNFDATYPPIFYWTMGIFASPDIDTSIITMRIVNAAIFVALLTGLFFLTRSHHRGGLIWGALVPIVPLGMFLIPSVNPSSWAIISACVLWVAVTAFLDEHQTWRRIALGAFAVLATVMAAGARSDAAVYSGIAIVAAVLLTFRRNRRYLLSLLFPLALVIVAVAFFFSTGQAAIVDPGTSPDAADLPSVRDVIAYDVPRLAELWAGALGTWGLGWVDTDMPGGVWVPVIGAYLGLLFWALQAVRRRGALAMAWVAFTLVLVPMYILIHDRVLVGWYVQPRYIYPLMFLLLGVALYALVRPDLGLRRTQLVVLVVALSSANVFALHANIRRYVTGTDLGGWNLSAFAEWWWDGALLGPLATWLVGSVAFAVAVAAIALGMRLSSPSLPPAPERLLPGVHTA